jgi:dolichol-phosphate mannosyltransferase
VKVAVVIPSYRSKQHVLGVLEGIGPECEAIYVVDDACPDGTGDHVAQNCSDPRVKVLHQPENQGVGGATMAGYRAAMADGADIVVKLDSDGQMDPAMILPLLRPIVDGEADYTKGNRFFDLDGLRSMPRLRLFGNSVLSFASKASSGYWNIFDPTNGFTAIHARVLRELPLDRISKRWFFESDMLFRLGTLRAVVADVPMPASYDEEQSSLVIRHVVVGFAFKHCINTLKRIFYNYYLRSFNIASIEILLGLVFILFGVTLGAVRWREVLLSGQPSTSGTVMLAALPVIIGVQLVLSFLNYELQNVPRDVLHKKLFPFELSGSSQLGPSRSRSARPGGPGAGGEDKGLADEVPEP